MAIRGAVCVLLFGLLIGACGGPSRSTPAAPTTPPAVSALKPPTVSLFTAVQTSIDPPKATLHWTIADATSATIDNTIGQVDPAGGTKTLSLPKPSTTFTLTATNRWGDTSATSTVVVSVPDVEYRLYSRDATFPVGLWEVSYIPERGEWVTVNYNHMEFGLKCTFTTLVRNGQGLGLSAYTDNTIPPGQAVVAEIWRRGKLLAAAEMTADNVKSLRGLIKVTATF